MSERHKATHLGYLLYHQQVLEDELEDLDSELSRIRSDLQGEKRLKAEKSRLLEFRSEVKTRLSKISKQTDGMLKHESDEMTGRAEKQRRSSYQTHKESDDMELESGDGFMKAGDMHE